MGCRSDQRHGQDHGTSGTIEGSVSQNVDPGPSCYFMKCRNLH